MIQEKIAQPPQRALILLIEDEPDMAHEIAKQLEQIGYIVKTTGTEASGLDAARSESASLIILDRMLNGVDSLYMIENLRSEGLRVPVLFVSSLVSVDERIRGLKAGGDDYLTKPFAMAELAARVEVLLRRSTDPQHAKLKVGPVEIDLIERRAWRGNRELSLLPREFKLLEYLMRHANQIVTRSMLLEDLWNFRSEASPNLIDVHIGKLKRKVDGPGEAPLIRNVRGSGFMFHEAD
jgi:two-component system OmpR family response regulator